MNKQAFNVTNLKKIYFQENRKGKYLESIFFPEVDEQTKKMSRCKKLIIKVVKKNKGQEKRLEQLYALKDFIYKKREAKIQEELEIVAQKISRMTSISISQGVIVGNKQTYKIVDTPELFFAEKKLQDNLKIVYGIKHADRNAIISCLINTLQDDTSKIILRLDIASFYESIDHDLLRAILKKNSLSLMTYNFILKILSEYNKLSSTNAVGLPRGIGSSAYLSEIFMQEIDSAIQELPHLSFYSRYVDDMILIFTPPITVSSGKYEQDVKEIIEGFKLKINPAPDKYKIVSVDIDTNFKIEYLGYSLEKNKNLKLALENGKLRKYKQKIELTINAYIASSKTIKNEKLFINRIRFLTGNTKLTNNKGGAFIGIYYSNKFLTEIKNLDGLDNFLASQLASKVANTRLVRKLRKLSFRAGFENKIFRYFLPCELSDITRIWK